MRFKRMLCLLMAVVMAIALVACGDGGTDDSSPNEQDTQLPTNAAELKGVDVAKFIKTFHREPSIDEEQTVYDSDEVTVTADRLRYDPIEGPAVRFRVDNRSERDLLVQVESCAVNGYMMKIDSFSLEVPADREQDGEMFVPYTALAPAGVDTIATVEVCLRLMEGGSYRVITESAPAVITTTAAQDHTPAYDDAGQSVYDADGIRIVLKGLDLRRQVSSSPALIVWMYNRTDRPISVQSGKVWVNGYELTSAMTVTVLPQKYAVDVVPFFDMDLEEYAIEEIDTVELSFRIVDEETWQTIAETQVIALEDV